MARESILRLFCDRCGLSEDNPPPERRWEQLSTLGERDKAGHVLRAPRIRDLCPDCNRAFERWMDKAKGDTATAA